MAHRRSVAAGRSKGPDPERRVVGDLPRRRPESPGNRGAGLESGPGFRECAIAAGAGAGFGGDRRLLPAGWRVAVVPEVSALGKPPVFGRGGGRAYHAKRLEPAFRAELRAGPFRAHQAQRGERQCVVSSRRRGCRERQAGGDRGDRRRLLHAVRGGCGDPHSGRYGRVDGEGHCARAKPSRWGSRIGSGLGPGASVIGGDPHAGQAGAATAREL